MNEFWGQGLDKRQARRARRRATRYRGPLLVRCPLCDAIIYRRGRRCQRPLVIIDVWPPGVVHTCARVRRDA